MKGVLPAYGCWSFTVIRRGIAMWVAAPWHSTLCPPDPPDRHLEEEEIIKVLGTAESHSSAPQHHKLVFFILPSLYILLSSSQWQSIHSLSTILFC